VNFFFNRFFKFIARFDRYLSKLFLRLKRKYIIWYYSVLYPNRINLKKDLLIGKNFKILFDNSKSSVNIGKGAYFRDYINIRSEKNSKIVIGDRVFFNSFCSIAALEEIIIGNDCSFGENVKIFDSNHIYKNPALLITEQGYSTGKIKIGNNCWIGSNVTILKNLEIGDHVVIGAGCTIYKSVPSNTLVINNQTIITKPL
jgi:acetyltransferase-like isoleucine patch superfamily enzyme